MNPQTQDLETRAREVLITVELRRTIELNTPYGMSMDFFVQSARRLLYSPTNSNCLARSEIF